MTVDIVLEAMENAIQAQNPGPGVIVHTDLGTQYTSEAFQEQLKKYEMIPSYSRKGCPYDNACIESFHAHSKKKRFIENDIQPLKMQESHYFNISKVGIIANEFIVELVTSLQMNTKRYADFQRKN